MNVLATLFKTTNQAMQVYVAALARDLAHWELDPPEWVGKSASQRALLFARTSALLSGIPSEELPADNVWRMDRQTQSTDIVEFFENDHVLAEVCMSDAGKIIPPEILNASLCRNRMNIRWRTGNDLSIESDLPDGGYSKELTRFWTSSAEIFGKHMRNFPEGDRRAYAWAMHHAFLCIKPFSTGNSRTARLCLQMCRTNVGLNPIAFRSTDLTKMRMHLETFRNSIFIPLMRSMGRM